ncbi:MAG: hypothetical protein CBC35_05960 [Planctomycetes bacterium TMED75]|nr:MAG: hypothetical protein CBC35_05960 [Planctomycetes bacterium TMED75]
MNPVSTFTISLALTTSLCSTANLSGQDDTTSGLHHASPEQREYTQHAMLLAHPALEGRLPGSPGIAAAEQAIVTSFQSSGFRPAFGKSYRQPFEFKQGGVFGNRSDAQIVTGVNVGATLPGTGALRDQWVVLGAHHDHIGFGAFGSRSTAEVGQVHEGADDNASGTAAVMLAARLLGERFTQKADSTPGETPRRSIMVVTFSGEESGLNGSRYFVEHSPIPIEQIDLMVNLDMVGRLVENKVQVCGTQSANVLPELVQAAAEGIDIIPVLATGLTSRSDHASFYREQVPVIFMTETVFPDEYHTPEDEAWRLNFTSATEAARLAANIVLMASLYPKQLEWQEVPGFETAEGGPSISDIKIRFGIKPGNYGDTEPGVLVSGVSSGTSAEEAGIMTDDLLTAWNGNQIIGVREWMLMMAEHEPGDIVTVTVLRNDESLDIPVMLKPR